MKLWYFILTVNLGHFKVILLRLLQNCAQWLLYKKEGFGRLQFYCMAYRIWIRRQPCAQRANCCIFLKFMDFSSCLRANQMRRLLLHAEHYCRRPTQNQFSKSRIPILKKYVRRALITNFCNLMYFDSTNF